MFTCLRIAILIIIIIIIIVIIIITTTTTTILTPEALNKRKLHLRGSIVPPPPASTFETVYPIAMIINIPVLSINRNHVAFN